MEDVLKLLGIILLIILLSALGIGVMLLSAWVTMWAWNIVVPYLFHLQQINIWQALGINVLIGILRGIFSVTVSKKS